MYLGGASDLVARAVGLPDDFSSKKAGGGVIQGSASEGNFAAVLAAKTRALQHMRRQNPGKTDQELMAKMTLYASDQASGHVLASHFFKEVNSNSLPGEIRPYIKMGIAMVYLLYVRAVSTQIKICGAARSTDRRVSERASGGYFWRAVRGIRLGSPKASPSFSQRYQLPMRTFLFVIVVMWKVLQILTYRTSDGQDMTRSYKNDEGDPNDTRYNSYGTPKNSIPDRRNIEGKSEKGRKQATSNVYAIPPTHPLVPTVFVLVL